MRFTLLTLPLIAGILLGGAGCQKASNAALVDESVEVPSQQTKAKIIDGPRREQKISVTAQSSAGSFSIYIVPEKEREALEAKLINLKAPTGGILAKKEGTTDATLEATIPAKEDFAVVLLNVGGKSVQVKLKVTNVP